MAQQHNAGKGVAHGGKVRRWSPKSPDGPVELLTTISFAPDTSMSIISATPILLNETSIIWSETPIMVKATAEELLTVQPHKILDPEFAVGWNKLPDELKVRILTYNVICEDKVSFNDQWGYTMGGNKDIISYCLMTPEIATLAREIFYSKNIFHVKALPLFEWIGERRTLPLPPRSSLGLIRRLEVAVRVIGWEFTKLRKLTDGRWGFHNLQHIKLTVDLTQHPGIPYSEIPCILGDGLFIQCDGEVDFVGMDIWSFPGSQLIAIIKTKFFFNCINKGLNGVKN
ncbi:hypothetical protein P280DRAFT_522837 [Massarina eburnea CBS 473.64]|uniref:Uncharacterized protein n=1 Tax=Massarina eburnea CBS 473.64 TaxID=1395130 RepID=A0A6A6RKW2_9PLEO|nr:hypothetical protein P280DRAFT_522837 [Massarina eburnea CBS 473.64]